MPEQPAEHMRQIAMSCGIVLSGAVLTVRQGIQADALGQVGLSSGQVEARSLVTGFQDTPLLAVAFALAGAVAALGARLRRYGEQ